MKTFLVHLWKEERRIGYVNSHFQIVRYGDLVENFETGYGYCFGIIDRYTLIENVADDGPSSQGPF